MPSTPPIRVPIIGEDRTARAIKSAESNIRGLGKTAKATFGALGIGIGVGAITRMVGQTIQYGSALTDAAAATRMGVEEYQALKFAAQEAGADMDKVTAASAKVQKAANDAANGLTTYTRAFDALGINVSQFRNLAPERQLEAIGRAMVAAKDPAKAYASALDIIGTRNAPRLMDVLQKLGTDGFDQMADAARNAGQVMSSETARSMDIAADAMERLQTRSKNFMATWMANAALGWTAWEKTSRNAFSDWKDFLQWSVNATQIWTGNSAAIKSTFIDGQRWVVGFEQALQEISTEFDAARTSADGFAGSVSSVQAEIDEMMALANAADPLKERFERLDRQLADSMRTPAENIAVLRDEIKKLKDEAQRMYDEGAQDPSAYWRTLSEATQKEIELRRLQQQVDREKGGPDSSMPDFSMPSRTSSAAVPFYDTPGQANQQRAYHPGGVYYQAMLERSQQRQSGGGMDLSGAADTIQSSTTGMADFMKRIVEIFKRLDATVETLEAQIQNQR